MRSFLGKPSVLMVAAVVATAVFVAISTIIEKYEEKDAAWSFLACAVGICLLVLVRRLHFAQRIRPQELGKNPPSSAEESSTLAGEI